MKISAKIMIVTGEDSGDSHAAKLVDSLRAEIPGYDLHFFGATGARMRETGVSTIVKSDDFGIFGIPEVLRAVPMFLGVMNDLIKAATEKKPDLVILVDFPEFNLKLAKKLKQRGFTVVYYISPQLWAWRKYRVRGIRKYVDLLLTIIPFEDDWYRQHGVEHTKFVGHPLSGKVRPTSDREDFCIENELDPAKPIVALLPGSRRKEIERIFAVMLSGASLLRAANPDIQFVVGLAQSRSETELARAAGAEGESVPSIVDAVSRDTYSLISAADAAVVTSGTATLETAIIGTPQVIVYRMSNLNYSLMRPLVSLESVGLANLIAGKNVFRELIQQDFTGEALCAELVRILEPAKNKELRAEAAGIAESLGDEDASQRAAREIIEFAGWKEGAGA